MYKLFTKIIFFIASIFFIDSLLVLPIYSMDIPTNQAEQETDRCPICFDTMDQDGNNQIQLTCHNTHLFHKRCLENWFNHALRLGQNLACVLCRKEISAEDRASLRLLELSQEELEVLRGPEAEREFLAHMNRVLEARQRELQLVPGFIRPFVARHLQLAQKAVFILGVTIPSALGLWLHYYFSIDRYFIPNF